MQRSIEFGIAVARHPRRRGVVLSSFLGLMVMLLVGVKAQAVAEQVAGVLEPSYTSSFTTVRDPHHFMRETTVRITAARNSTNPPRCHCF